MAVNIGPRIGIDGEAEYRKQIQRIIQETKTLKSEYEKVSSAMEKGKTTLRGNAEQHRILSEQIKVQEQRVKELSDMVEKSSAKFGDADQKTLKWKEALYAAETELNNLRQELKDLPNQIELVGQKMEVAGDKIKSIGGDIESFGQSLMPMSAAATGALVASAKAAVDFETAMTGVKKTNDELVDSNGNVIISYDDLADSIKQMATETASSKEEIATVMEAAGQLGVGTKYLSDFTKTMIMLGDSTNLSAEEAASGIAKFANVTQMSLNDADKLGSVIVDLGNNYATTEQDIMNMATRLSGAGHQIGLTEAQIMGFATALSSVGIEAEMGGSAFSKAMIKMQVAVETGDEAVKNLQARSGKTLRELELMASNDSKSFKELAQSLGMTTKEMQATITAGNNLNDFAKVANMTTDEFVSLYRKDAPEALQAFISGLGDVEGHGQTTIAMLQEMGFTEVRLRDTLTRLAGSGNLVTDAISTANTAWAENTALTDEAEKKYGTMAAQMQQTKEKLSNIGIEIGERLLPYVDRGLDAIDRVISAWDQLSDEEQDQIVKATLLAAAAAPVVIGLGNVTTALGGIISGGGKALQVMGSLAGSMSGAATAAGSLGSGAGAASAGIAGIAAPAAIATGALVLLSGAFITAYNNDAEFAKRVDEDWASIKASITDVINTIKPEWEAFSNFFSPVFTSAMESIERRLDQFKTNFQGWANLIHGILEGDWSRAWDGAKQVVFSTNAAMEEDTRTEVSTMEGLFRNMNIQLPHIKLPHFKVTGEDGWGLPHISIDWYAKAMDGGMRLTSPTIFGANNGSLMAGGEAGNEWVVGESSILSMIRSAVHQAVGYIPDTGNTVNIGDTRIIINAAPGQDIEELANEVDEIISARYEQARNAWAQYTNI